MSSADESLRTRQETNPIAAYTVHHAHKLKAFIHGRHLSFELPADFPIGQAEVIILVAENLAVDELIAERRAEAVRQ